MKIIAVIPARFASTRFPAKPLALLKGRPLIEWVIEGAQSCHYLQEIYVATDHLEIAEVVKKMGAPVLMTSPDCATGTDRIFEATKNLTFDVVLNIQGDEPQISKKYLDPLAQSFMAEPTLEMATLSHPMKLEDLNNKNAVKVIKNMNNEAIYFSRFAVPYSREEAPTQLVCEKHIGLYGYSKAFLKKFCEASQAAIEKAESLEQLRALYLGAKIKVLSVDEPIQGVDTPEDLMKLEKMLKVRNEK